MNPQIKDIAVEASQIRVGLLDLEARAEALAAAMRSRPMRKVMLSLVAARRTLGQQVDAELARMRRGREVRCA